MRSKALFLSALMISIFLGHGHVSQANIVSAGQPPQPQTMQNLSSAQVTSNPIRDLLDGLETDLIENSREFINGIIRNEDAAIRRPLESLRASLHEGMLESLEQIHDAVTQNLDPAFREIQSSLNNFLRATDRVTDVMSMRPWWEAANDLLVKVQNLREQTSSNQSAPRQP